jgi:aryl-alcohol dehydrogenase-like predicted oxidoreductase
MTLRPEPYQKLLDEKIYHGLEALRAHAAERGTDMASLALAWVMSHPLVTAPILGPRKPEHLEPAKRAMEIKLTDEERDKIAAFLS